MSATNVTYPYWDDIKGHWDMGPGNCEKVLLHNYRIASFAICFVAFILGIYMYIPSSRFYHRMQRVIRKMAIAPPTRLSYLDQWHKSFRSHVIGGTIVPCILSVVVSAFFIIVPLLDRGGLCPRYVHNGYKAVAEIQLVITGVMFICFIYPVQVLHLYYCTRGTSEWWHDFMKHRKRIEIQDDNDIKMALFTTPPALKDTRSQEHAYKLSTINFEV